METINLRSYFYSLSKEQRAVFAQKSGTSVAYMQNYWVGPDPTRRRIPREKALRKIAEASEGALTIPLLLNYFYEDA